MAINKANLLYLEHIDAVDLPPGPPLRSTAPSPSQTVAGNVKPGQDPGLTPVHHKPPEASIGHTA